jgi:hypothetical protein
MSQDKQEYYKNEIVHSLAEAIKRGGRSLQSVPGLLAKCISEDLWVERDVNGQAVTYDKAEFKRFVESPYPNGLDTTIETIERLCSDEPEIKDFLAAAKRGKVGRPPKAQGQTDSRGKVNENVQNMHDYRSTGKTDYAYNRLRDDAPELHARVISGELSPHAAMIEAGFRPRKVSINMDNAESAYKTITGHMKPDVLRELIDLLNNWQE